MQTFAPIREKLNPNIAAQRIFSLIKAEMNLVETEFERQASSNIQVINYLGDYLRASGGKRVRPALLILSNCATGGTASNENVISLATVMEMLHTATLVHDDIIDDAEVRRGRPSVNATWGNDISVLMGDWLYMKAFEVTLSGRNFDVLDLLTTMTRSMTEGELLQLDLLGRIDITEAEHLEIVRRKTAFMFSSCAEIGAIVAGASRAERKALSDYGINAGIAFQLIDDVLDFVSTEDKLGKPVANDLREGKLTLPLIYLLEGWPEHANTIETVVRERGFESVSREQVLDLVRRRGTLDRAKDEARRYAALAAEALGELEDSPFRRALFSIPNFIVERET